MAADGRRQNPRQQVAVGPADFPTAKNLEASIYEAEPPPDRGGNAAQ